MDLNSSPSNYKENFLIYSNNQKPSREVTALSIYAHIKFYLRGVSYPFMRESEVSLGGKIRRGIAAVSLAAGMITAQPQPNLENIICLKESTSYQCDNGKVWDGYWWRKKVWIPSYPSLETWFTPAPDYSRGGVVFYDDGVIEANARERGLSLKGYMGGVALMSPADIGLPVWMRLEGGQWEGPFLDVDSASRGDITPIINYRKEIVEVSYQQAQKWGMIDQNGKVLKWRLDNVEISKLPPEYLNDEPVDYRNWWLNSYKPAGKERVYQTPPYKPPSSWYINEKWISFHSPVTKEELIYSKSTQRHPK